MYIPVRTVRIKCLNHKHHRTHESFVQETHYWVNKASRGLEEKGQKLVQTKTCYLIYYLVQKRFFSKASSSVFSLRTMQVVQDDIEEHWRFRFSYLIDSNHVSGHRQHSHKHDRISAAQNERRRVHPLSARDCLKIKPSTCAKNDCAG